MKYTSRQLILLGTALVLLLTVVFFGDALFGGGAPPVLPTPTAGIIPETPTPPPTAEELRQLQAVASRLTVMYRAARDLSDSQIATGADWQGNVHTRATMMLGAKGGIEKAVLPERYRTPRLAEILTGCGTMAERLSRADLRRSDVLSIDGLERCVNGLREMEFIYTEYTK